MRKNHAPYWGAKLFLPSFSKDEKIEKFYQQWQWKLGLEAVKMRHALLRRPFDKHQEKQFKQEIENYLSWVEQQQIEHEMRDVYITNHEPRDKKFATTSQEDDQQFFNYQRSLQEYQNAPGLTAATALKPSTGGRYERGSLLQKVLEPLAAARRLENGTLLYDVEDQDLAYLQTSDDRLRDIWAKCKQNVEEAGEFSEED
jgi:hypothetical protein